MNDHCQPGRGWTVVLRRQPSRIVEGRPEGGYTDAYELVCCDRGDDPDMSGGPAPMSIPARSPAVGGAVCRGGRTK
jgi:hypothetical protein